MKEIGYLMRLKNDVPFSEMLNDWIKRRVKDIPYKLIKENHPFESLKELHKHTGLLHINELFCEDNIFGNKEDNINFRIWHDFIHIKYNLDFTLEGEEACSIIQQHELPVGWDFERKLIKIEIEEQTKYRLLSGEFLEHQRQFTIDYLKAV